MDRRWPLSNPMNPTLALHHPRNQNNLTPDGTLSNNIRANDGYLSQMNRETYRRPRVALGTHRNHDGGRDDWQHSGVEIRPQMALSSPQWTLGSGESGNAGRGPPQTLPQHQQRLHYNERIISNRNSYDQQRTKNVSGSLNANFSSPYRPDHTGSADYNQTGGIRNESRSLVGSGGNDRSWHNSQHTAGNLQIAQNVRSAGNYRSPRKRAVKRRMRHDLPGPAGALLRQQKGKRGLSQSSVKSEEIVSDEYEQRQSSLHAENSLQHGSIPRVTPSPTNHAAVQEEGNEDCQRDKHFLPDKNQSLSSSTHKPQPPLSTEDLAAKAKKQNLYHDYSTDLHECCAWNLMCSTLNRIVPLPIHPYSSVSCSHSPSLRAISRYKRILRRSLPSNYTFIHEIQEGKFDGNHVSTKIYKRDLTVPVLVVYVANVECSAFSNWSVWLVDELHGLYGACGVGGSGKGGNLENNQQKTRSVGRGGIVAWIDERMVKQHISWVRPGAVWMLEGAKLSLFPGAATDDAGDDEGYLSSDSDDDCLETVVGDGNCRWDTSPAAGIARSGGGIDRMLVVDESSLVYAWTPEEAETSFSNEELLRLMEQRSNFELPYNAEALGPNMKDNYFARDDFGLESRRIEKTGAKIDVATTRKSESTHEITPCSTIANSISPKRKRAPLHDEEAPLDETRNAISNNTKTPGTAQLECSEPNHNPQNHSTSAKPIPCRVVSANVISGKMNKEGPKRAAIITTLGKRKQLGTEKDENFTSFENDSANPDNCATHHSTQNQKMESTIAVDSTASDENREEVDDLMHLIESTDDLSSQNNPPAIDVSKPSICFEPQHHEDKTQILNNTAAAATLASTQLQLSLKKISNGSSTRPIRLSVTNDSAGDHLPDATADQRNVHDISITRRVTSLSPSKGESSDNLFGEEMEGELMTLHENDSFEPSDRGKFTMTLTETEVVELNDKKHELLFEDETKPRARIKTDHGKSLTLQSSSLFDTNMVGHESVEELLGEEVDDF